VWDQDEHACSRLPGRRAREGTVSREFGVVCLGGGVAGEAMAAKDATLHIAGADGLAKV
jgi:hypothetical protein